MLWSITATPGNCTTCEGKRHQNTEVHPVAFPGGSHAWVGPTPPPLTGRRERLPEEEEGEEEEGKEWRGMSRWSTEEVVNNGSWSGIRLTMWVPFNRKQHVTQAQAHRRARSWPCAHSWAERGHIHSNQVFLGIVEVERLTEQTAAEALRQRTGSKCGIWTCTTRSWYSQAKRNRPNKETNKQKQNKTKKTPGFSLCLHLYTLTN